METLLNLVNKVKRLMVVSLIAGWPFLAEATHVKGGYIRAAQTSASNREFAIQLVGYTDTGSAVAFGGGEIDFGDGRLARVDEEALSRETIDLGNGVAKHIYTIAHSYQAPGTYLISYSENYRNAGIHNLSNPVQTAFYVETTVLVDPLVGFNSTPTLVADPGTYAKAGERFYNSLACYDEQGDSLVYSFAVPLEAHATHTAGFKWPNDAGFYTGPGDVANPAFSMDKLSGQFTLDAPHLEGEFVLAYRILEYRKVDVQWHLLSTTHVDFQLNAIETTESSRTIDFEHSFTSEGEINFSVEFSDVAGDSLTWAFYANKPVVWEGVPQQQNYLNGKEIEGAVFSGLIVPEPGSVRPVIVVAEASGVVQGSRLKTVKSYAIHPEGKEYMLTAVNKKEVPGKVSIYPNPVETNLTIHIESETIGRPIDVQIMSFSGQTILKGGVPVSGKIATLNIEGIPAGIYLIKINQSEKTYLTKFVKN